MMPVCKGFVRSFRPFRSLGRSSLLLVRNSRWERERNLAPLAAPDVDGQTAAAVHSVLDPPNAAQFLKQRIPQLVLGIHPRCKLFEQTLQYI